MSIQINNEPIRKIQIIREPGNAKLSGYVTHVLLDGVDVPAISLDISVSDKGYMFAEIECFYDPRVVIGEDAATYTITAEFGNVDFGGEMVVSTYDPVVAATPQPEFLDKPLTQPKQSRGFFDWFRKK